MNVKIKFISIFCRCPFLNNYQIIWIRGVLCAGNRHTYSILPDQNTRMPSIVDKNILIACTWRRALFYYIFTNERIGTNSTKCQILTSYLTIRYDLLFSNFVVACQNGTRKSGTGLIYSSERNMRVIEARKLKKKLLTDPAAKKHFLNYCRISI